MWYVVMAIEFQMSSIFFLCPGNFLWRDEDTYHFINPRAEANEKNEFWVHSLNVVVQREGVLKAYPWVSVFRQFLPISLNNLISISGGRPACRVFSSALATVNIPIYLQIGKLKI